MFYYITSSDAAVKIPEEKEKIFETDNLDSLFGDSVVKKVETKPDQYKISGLIGRKVVKKNLDIDSGAYNLVFIKIKDPEAIEEYVEKLNSSLKKAGAEGKAITWKQATGQLADMATIIRGALFGFVLFIFFVAIIIIMNTLSMAAMERLNEIGMMRAVGAQRSFVGWMFFFETSFLSFLFGGAGIISGIITVIIFNFFNITTDNHILQLLYGGSVFRPFLGFFDVFIGIFELGVVTVIAIIYPLKVARRITPLEAIARD
ncbi:MAG: FtsX-like permease family protein, partial [Spirochaetes bacterium]|nr:FtsX-like permease family protein [Spirochaetota bacterium]